MSYPQQKFRNTRFSSGSFWAKKRAKLSSTAALYQLDVMKQTGRYDAFKLKWKDVYDEEKDAWPVPMHAFWDSDIAKFLEGACYFLTQEENPAIRTAVEELVDMIASAQQPDGYLNIHFTVVDPEGRFKNLRDQHELYNAGHLIEAALAHEQLYGNQKLLGPILKYVDLLAEVFGPKQGQKPGYPGHPETELALLRLYDRTGDPKHLELGKFFLTERGNPHGIDGKHYYDYEAELRGEGPHEVADAVPRHRSYWYQQAHVPLLEQQTIEGHSVRAAYLLTGLAELVRVDKALDKTYSDALHRLWDNMVQKKMYLTGGIGAMKQWEGFGIDYFLPQGTDEGGCYAETCASIGVMFWASRLLETERNGHFGDIMELQLYNAVLTGVSLDGRSWTYVNQLASSDTDLSKRADWFDVSCCPPNVLRLLGSLGGYFYSFNSSGASKAELTITMYANMDIVETVGDHEIKVSMKTKWPLDGTVIFNVSAPASVQLAIYYRVPSWAPSGGLVEPKGHKITSQKGYARLDPSFVQENSSFVLSFPMEARMISPHPFTGQTAIAVQRGPLVYCCEDVDNDWVTDHFKRTYVSADPKRISEKLTVDDSTGEEYVAISVEYKQPTQMDTSKLESEGPGHASRSAGPEGNLKGPNVLKYVPYYFRANRGGKGQMRVGMMSTCS